MKKMRLNKLKYIILLFLTISFCFANIGEIKYKLTPNQKKALNQAKSLKKNGLIQEAKNIYISLFYDYAIR